MFRKIIIAAAATASLAAAALTPTAASAAPHGHWGQGFHGHWGGGFHGHWGGWRGRHWGGRFFHGPRFVGGFYGPCRWVHRPVPTPIGPQFRWVRVCYY